MLTIGKYWTELVASVIQTYHQLKGVSNPWVPLPP